MNDAARRHRLLKSHKSTLLFCGQGAMKDFNQKSANTIRKLAVIATKA
jgi:hypothetical protein